MRTRWTAFVAVGVLGFAVQLGALLLLARSGVPTLVATACAVEAAILHNFLWHERWTWRSGATASAASVLTRLARFNGAAALVSIAGNVAITWMLAHRLGLSLPLANAAAVVVLSAMNFLIADRWIWRHRPASTQPAHSAALVLPAIGDRLALCARDRSGPNPAAPPPARGGAQAGSGGRPAPCLPPAC
jgi:putative flippase GtrA